MESSIPKPIMKPDSELTPEEYEQLCQGVDDYYFPGLTPQAEENRKLLEAERRQESGEK